MASVTLYQRYGLSRLRLRPPRGSVRSAAVLERRGGYLLVTHDQKVDPMTFIGGRYRQLFEVNLTPLQVTYERYVLPSSELARSFLVNLELSVEVEDALKVVQEQKTDPWEAIEPLLEEAREQHLRNLEDQRRVLYEQVVGEGVIPKLLLIKLGARPAGGDP